MAAGDVTITRGIGFRDDMISIANWSVGLATMTTDGDIASVTNGTVTENTSPLSTNTYKFAIFRVNLNTASSIVVAVTYTDTTNTQQTITTPNWQVITLTLTAGKTVQSVSIQIGAPGSNTGQCDFVYIFKETLTLPAVSDPLQLSLRRRVIELPIPTREGGILQDLGSTSAQLELAGTLITTTSPNNYTGDQWWDVLVGLWLEANWQWVSSDRVAYKYQIEELNPVQDPGKVGYYGYKLRLRKVDIPSATAQTFASSTGTGAIQ